MTIDLTSKVSTPDDLIAILLYRNEKDEKKIPLKDLYVIADMPYLSAKNQADGKLYHLHFLGLADGALGWRVARRLHYAYTVPLDVVTFPFQALLVGIVLAAGIR